MRQYVPDAFTDKVFAGNSAAVCGSGRCRIVPYRTDTPCCGTPVAYQWASPPRRCAVPHPGGRAHPHEPEGPALYAVSDIFVD